ncbi:MAG: hypothetical protein N2112_12940 [Gemmataceae bacterium]|nr:hypothetical protein [Gemmataceae bacterium]
MSRFVFTFALLGSLMMILMGCDSSSKGTADKGGTGGSDKKANPLVGTWEGTDPELKGLALVFAFAADGKFTVETVMEGMNDPKGPKIEIDGGKQEGTYKQEEKSIITNVKGKEKKLTIKEMSDTKMVLTNSEGKDMTFNKKK